MGSKRKKSHVAETRAELVKGKDVLSAVQQLAPHSRGQMSQQQVALFRMLQIGAEIFHLVVDGYDLTENRKRHGEQSVGYEHPSLRISAVLRKRRDEHPPVDLALAIQLRSPTRFLFLSRIIIAVTFFMVVVAVVSCRIRLRLGPGNVGRVKFFIEIGQNGRRSTVETVGQIPHVLEHNLQNTIRMNTVTPKETPRLLALATVTHKVLLEKFTHFQKVLL